MVFGTVTEYYREKRNPDVHFCISWAINEYMELNSNPGRKRCERWAHFDNLKMKTPYLRDKVFDDFEMYDVNVTVTDVKDLPYGGLNNG